MAQLESLWHEDPLTKDQLLQIKTALLEEEQLKSMLKDYDKLCNQLSLKFEEFSVASIAASSRGDAPWFGGGWESEWKWFNIENADYV